LILAEWDYINKYYPDRSLSPEWADNSRTPAGVAANNPLGHVLYQNYLSKIVAKPSSGILDAMYAVDGTSGYIATSTGRGSVEPVDCTVDSIADSTAELQAAAEQAAANVAELQAAADVQAAAEQAAANAAAEAAANAAAEEAANAAAEAQAAAEADTEPVQQASGGCGPGTVMVNGVCELVQESELKGTSVTMPAFEPLYIIIAVVAVGGGVGAILIIKKGSGGAKPARQEPRRTLERPTERVETSAFCQGCGAELKPETKFCGKCGTPKP
jgi:hypothetical protein